MNNKMVSGHEAMELLADILKQIQVHLPDKTLTFIVRTPGDDTNFAVVSNESNYREIIRVLEGYISGKLKPKFYKDGI